MVYVHHEDPVQLIESITCIPSVVQQECVGDRTDRTDRMDQSHGVQSMESVTGTAQRQACVVVVVSVLE